MDIPERILFFMALLIVALAAQPVAQRIRVPFSALLVLFGYIGSELIIATGLDTGLRWHEFHDIVLYVLLPVLIFESALNLDAKLFVRNLIPILLLAVPLMLLSAGITAAILYFSIGHSEGFPWLAALITGAILAATDPVAVVDIFRKAGLPERLLVLVEGESLLNDATAIVLFMVFLSVVLGDVSSVTFSGAALQFLKIFAGGLAVGTVTGFAAGFLIRFVRDGIHRGVLSLISAYVGFLVAEAAGLSGVMAVLVTGILFGLASIRYPEVPKESAFVPKLWSFIAYVANVVIFLLVGITVHASMFADRWLAMLLGIIAVLAARAIGIFGVMPLVLRLPGLDSVGPGYQVCLYWGGLRGAVALALALSLPTSLDSWFTIQSITYGVVLFTLFVQAPTMPFLMRRVHFRQRENDG